MATALTPYPELRSPGVVKSWEATCRRGLLEETGQGVCRRTIGYDSNAHPKRMKQLPPQDKDRRVARFLRHQAPLYALGAWVAPERVKSGHEASFNQCFHKTHPMQVMGREAEGLLVEIVDGRRPSVAMRMGAG